MLEPQTLFQYALADLDPNDTIHLSSTTDVDDVGSINSFVLSSSKACFLLQDAALTRLPFDATTCAVSSDGLVVSGWTGKTLNVLYGGEPILCRAIDDLPSPAWKSFLVKTRVASASFFELVLVVVCADGSLCRVRLQGAHVTVQVLAQVLSSHPVLTACDVRGDLVVLAGGIRSATRDMEHGSSLSLWNILDETAELLHYSTVLAHDKIMDESATDDAAAIDASSSSLSWWSSATSLLTGAAPTEHIFPGNINQICISPDGALVALRDSSGHISIRQVDTCAQLVGWSLVHDAKVSALAWFQPQQLVVALTTSPLPLVCDVLEDNLSIPPLNTLTVVDADASLVRQYRHALATAHGCFFHACGLLPDDDADDVTTPFETVVFAARLTHHRFDDALALAAAHPAELDSDVVHQAAWMHHMSSDTIDVTRLDTLVAAHLARMRNTAWVVEAAKRAVLDSSVACHRLWTFGLTLEPTDATLAQLVDRLETFLRVVHAEEERAADDITLETLVATLDDAFDSTYFFDVFVAASWVDLALALAYAGRVRALTVLFGRHGYHVLPARCRILAALPASVPPAAFQHLLPCVPAWLDDKDAAHYVLDPVHADRFVAAPLRMAPDVTSDVVAHYNAQLAPAATRRAALCDWFVARCFEMDSLFGLLADAHALLALSLRCLGPNVAHDALTRLRREFDALHLFVYEFELTPTWTIQDWQRQASPGQVKINLVRQAPQSLGHVHELLGRGLVTESDVAAAVAALDMTDLAAFTWAAEILAASSPVSIDRFLTDTRLLAQTALACCFGFDLATTDRPQDYIECAWAIFQTLPKVLPDPALQAEVDALEHFMTGMEILSSYSLFHSPATLRAHTADAAFAASLIKHCCTSVAADSRQYEKALDDLLQLRDHAFPTALSTDAAIELVCQSLLSAATTPSPVLRQLCPSPAIFRAAAVAHFEAASSASSPAIALALTYLAWVEDQPMDDENENEQTTTTDVAALVHATEWLEQCKGEAIAPAAMAALSPAARLACIQDLLVNRPAQCIDQLARLPDVAQWLSLGEKLPYMQVWAAYAYLQSRHVNPAIDLTIALLHSTQRPTDPGFQAQVTSLTLDLVGMGGHYRPRLALARTALTTVDKNDPATLFVLLDWTKKLDAIVRGLTILALEDDDVAAEKGSLSDYAWLADQLSVHQDVVQDHPSLLRQSLVAAVALDLAFQLHVPSTAAAAGEDGGVRFGGPSLQPRLARLASLHLVDDDDVDMAVAYLRRLPVDVASDVWAGAITAAIDDAAAQTRLAQAAQVFFETHHPQDATAAQRFASLQTTSQQAADLDVLAALHPSLDRSRFQVDHVYRYAMLVQCMQSNRWDEAANVCAMYEMQPWEMHVQYLDALLVGGDVAAREVELKHAQRPAPAAANGTLSVLEHVLTQPVALSQHLLQHTWTRLDPFDSIAWEYVWRLLLECQKRDASSDVPTERLKLFVACAKKLREGALAVHLAHFCGTAAVGTHNLGAETMVSAAIHAALPLLSPTSIRLVAMLLTKLHGVPASALLLIYVDSVLASNDDENDGDTAYAAATPLLPGLSTDHLLVLVSVCLATSPMTFELHGYVFQSPWRFAPRLSPIKRLEIAADVWRLVQGRTANTTAADTRTVERHVLWALVAAFGDHCQLAPSLAFPAPSTAADRTRVLTTHVGAWYAQPLSLDLCHELVDLVAALDDDDDALARARATFQRHVTSVLDTYVPELTAAESTTHPLYQYLHAKWTPPTTTTSVVSTLLPTAASLPSLKPPASPPLDSLFCNAVLAYLDDVEPSAATCTLLVWLETLVPVSVCGAFASTHVSAAVVVAQLYDLAGDVDWKQYQPQIAHEFAVVFDVAMTHVRDALDGNLRLAKVVAKWGDLFAPAGHGGWAAELARVVAERLELDDAACALPFESTAETAPLYQRLWQRSQWQDASLDAFLAATPAAYASLTEANVRHFLQLGCTTVALRSPFSAVHSDVFPSHVHTSSLTTTQLELLLTRFPIDALVACHVMPWDRVVRLCLRAERRQATQPDDSTTPPNALATVLHLVYALLVDEEFALLSRVLCQVAHVHPMLWTARTLYAPLLAQYRAGLSRRDVTNPAHDALVEKIDYLLA
ncbi:Aste57867_10655 [Aphanomyces stellatus]|uniref:Aste57867_10655 protein n=1 Tax=Aphanomyces stellatus TaxID=120398 RepID=A0A485KQY2_9STRA|nr:hypothetical protein As57867_010615 [Aphanomyces stellatus]VFT87527.1 Aste57867_10655 [Aphanomyces stellatus]